MMGRTEESVDHFSQEESPDHDTLSRFATRGVAWPDTGPLFGRKGRDGRHGLLD
jgi:hypothetical protein